MFFWITLGAFLLGAAMCWFAELRRTVVIAVLVWIGGFFLMPQFVGAGWAFMAMQAVLALFLLLRWKIDEAF